MQAQLFGFSAGEVLMVELVRKEKFGTSDSIDRARGHALPRGGLISLRWYADRDRTVSAEEKRHELFAQELRGAPALGGQAKIIILGI